MHAVELAGDDDDFKKFSGIDFSVICMSEVFMMIVSICIIVILSLDEESKMEQNKISDTPFLRTHDYSLLFRGIIKFILICEKLYELSLAGSNKWSALNEKT